FPPGEWDPAIRIEPPAAIPSQDTRKRPPEYSADELDEEEEEQKLRDESGLSRTGVLFGGLMNDLRRKAPWYWSDFTDALSTQCIASWIFLYFACLSPIITFGGLLSQATGKNMAAMESLVSGFICGIGYGLFSGQPLTILGSTGPVLVFETIVFDFCGTMGWDYLSFRFWIGTWIAVILFFLVAIDASAFVCYITRF
nr:Na[+]-driven anion exchanger 1 [Cucujiformia]